MQLCQFVNRYLGTDLAPWELDRVPDVWLSEIQVAYSIQTQVNEGKRGN